MHGYFRWFSCKSFLCVWRINGWWNTSYRLMVDIQSFVYYLRRLLNPFCRRVRGSNGAGSTRWQYQFRRKFWDVSLGVSMTGQTLAHAVSRFRRHGFYCQLSIFNWRTLGIWKRGWPFTFLIFRISLWCRMFFTWCRHWIIGWKIGYLHMKRLVI